MFSFPVLLNPEELRQRPDCPLSIPWPAIAPHERQVKINHADQSLAQLAERGGLGPEEIYAVCKGIVYRSSPPPCTFDEAVDFVKTLGVSK